MPPDRIYPRKVQETLFLGRALAILAIILLLRRSPRAPAVAIVAAVLFLPAFLSEQFGLFSALRPPVAIETVEWVQAALAVIAIGLGVWILRRGAAPTTTRSILNSGLGGFGLKVGARNVAGRGVIGSQLA